jgi:hypothetical protein
LGKSPPAAKAELCSTNPDVGAPEKSSPTLTAAAGEGEATMAAGDAAGEGAAAAAGEAAGDAALAGDATGDAGLAAGDGGAATLGAGALVGTLVVGAATLQPARQSVTTTHRPGSERSISCPLCLATVSTVAKSGVQQ